MPRDWWDNGQIQIFAAQWLMGHFFVWICQSLRLLLKRKMPTGQHIVEETLTSGKYISLFLILILYIYIYNFKKNTWRPAYFLKKYAKTGNQRKLRKWREQMHPFCWYSSSENINCNSVQAARKKYVNNIKCALDFYYYSPFLYGNTEFLNIWYRWKTWWILIFTVYLLIEC